MDKDRITIISTEIGFIVEIEVNLIISIEKEETFNITKIIDPTIELEVDQEIAMGIEMDIEAMIDMTVDQIIEETIIGKITETKGTGIEAQVKTMIGLGLDIEIIPGTTSGMGPYNRDQTRNRDISSSRDEGQGPEQF